MFGRSKTARGMSVLSVLTELLFSIRACPQNLTMHCIEVLKKKLIFVSLPPPHEKLVFSLYKNMSVYFKNFSEILLFL